jgi:hypothetical protein
MTLPGTISRARSAFTLIELIISGALMALILTSAYLCLNAGYSSQKIIDPRVDAFQTARVAVALMSADLRSACPLSKDFEFVGMPRMLGEVEADNLDFATHHYTPRRPREGDYCQVSYFLDRDPQSGEGRLWRRRNPTIALDPFSGGSREKIADDVLGLKLEYYDGLDWYDSWGDAEGNGKQQSSLLQPGNVSGLPEAVRITLMIDSAPSRAGAGTTEMKTNAAPLVFQTVVRLNLADAAQSGSTGAGSSSGAGQDNGDQTASPPDNESSN